MRWPRAAASYRDAAGAASSAGWVLAMMVAIGIGLHNFGEGLAIGSAFALGELALGTLLIVGFTLHNTTEGLAIIAPLARERDQQKPIGIGKLIQLGLIGGVPTILGAWLGWVCLLAGAGRVLPGAGRRRHRAGDADDPLAECRQARSVRISA